MAAISPVVNTADSGYSYLQVLRLPPAAVRQGFAFPFFAGESAECIPGGRFLLLELLDGRCVFAEIHGRGVNPAKLARQFMMTDSEHFIYERSTGTTCLGPTLAALEWEMPGDLTRRGVVPEDVLQTLPRISIESLRACADVMLAALFAERMIGDPPMGPITLGLLAREVARAIGEFVKRLDPFAQRALAAAGLPLTPQHYNRLRPVEPGATNWRAAAVAEYPLLIGCLLDNETLEPSAGEATRLALRRLPTRLARPASIATVIAESFSVSEEAVLWLRDPNNQPDNAAWRQYPATCFRLIASMTADQRPRNGADWIAQRLGGWAAEALRAAGLSVTPANLAPLLALGPENQALLQAVIKTHPRMARVIAVQAESAFFHTLATDLAAGRGVDPAVAAFCDITQEEASWLSARQWCALDAEWGDHPVTLYRLCASVAPEQRPSGMIDPARLSTLAVAALAAANLPLEAPSFATLLSAPRGRRTYLAQSVLDQPVLQALIAPVSGGCAFDGHFRINLRHPILAGASLHRLIARALQVPEETVRWMRGKTYQRIGASWANAPTDVYRLMAAMAPEHRPATPSEWTLCTAIFEALNCYDTGKLSKCDESVAIGWTAKIGAKGWKNIVPRLEKMGATMDSWNGCKDFMVAYEELIAEKAQILENRPPHLPDRFSRMWRTQNPFSVLDTSMRWHHRLTTDDGDSDSDFDPSLTWPAAIEGLIPVGGYECRFLTSITALQGEGIAMRHCVASYAQRCFRDGDHLVSIRPIADGIRTTAALQIRRHCGMLQFHSMEQSAYKNRGPNDAERAALATLLEYLNAPELASRREMLDVEQRLRKKRCDSARWDAREAQLLARERQLAQLLPRQLALDQACRQILTETNDGGTIRQIRPGMIETCRLWLRKLSF